MNKNSCKVKTENTKICSHSYGSALKCCYSFFKNKLVQHLSKQLTYCPVKQRGHWSDNTLNAHFACAHVLLKAVYTSTSHQMYQEYEQSKH